MKTLTALLLLTLLTTTAASAKPTPMDWPQSWTTHIGKKVTLYGKAIDEKSGAALYCVGKAFCPAIYIDGLDTWPDGLYLGGDAGKSVIVTGTVIERDDLPVFIENKNEPAKQGIPVPPGTDLKKASHRFLLKDAKWEVAK